MARIDLHGTVVIVTGASRGIGEAIATTLVEHGANVAITGRKLDTLTQVADAIHAVHGPNRVLPLAAHGGREEECRRVVQATAQHFGKVDGVINNAATNLHFGPLVDVDMAAWDKTFELNLKGYFWMAREVARHLQENQRAGCIVNVTSVAGLEAAPMQGMYGMTKAAIVSMTKTLAVELGPSNIRVNAIAPGLIETKFSTALVQNESIRNHIVGKTPLHCYGQPDDIAVAAAYLVSEASRFMTGHTLVLDGGLTIS